MNRRKFFRWLGLGAATVAVAPSAVDAGAARSVAMQTGCSCSVRSLREGPCDYCYEDEMECGCKRAYGCTCKVLTLDDYSSFSVFALTTGIDDAVSNAAAELSYQAGLSISGHYKAVMDGPRSFRFGI